tara:strand:- start:285 stop:392 length:108 start_codon:yes stop_codon:yes gene_type:complete
MARPEISNALNAKKVKIEEKKLFASFSISIDSCCA